MTRTFSFAAVLVLLLSWIPLRKASAAPLPEPPKGTVNPSSKDLTEGIYTELGGFMTPVYGWAVDFFTITFVVGTIVMILSIMFKNGQWQKYAQSTMLVTFIIMLLMRGVPIIVLSVNSPGDIDMMLLGAVEVLGAVAIFIAAISLPVSFLFKFGYHLIEHPKYHRWSRNLLSVSALMITLAVIIPWIFPQI